MWSGNGYGEKYVYCYIHKYFHAHGYGGNIQAMEKIYTLLFIIWMTNLTLGGPRGVRPLVSPIGTSSGL